VTSPRADRARLAAQYRESDYPLQDLTGRIIAAFLDVHRTHGYGFLESVYRKALAIELEHRGLLVEQLARYELFHRGRPIGIYEADLVAERSVILEAKTGLMDPVAQAQLLNYLRASRLQVGLVLHFGPRPIIKRVVSSAHHARIGTASVVDPDHE
jgi:GxxExxY protein